MIGIVPKDGAGFKIVSSALLGTIIFLVGLIGYYPIHRCKEESYYSKVQPICQQVMRKFDKNKDDCLQYNEGIEMARAVGYNKILPSENLLFYLEPRGWHSDTIGLYISSHGSHIGGLSSGNPAWYDIFEFPLSKLEELAK